MITNLFIQDSSGVKNKPASAKVASAVFDPAASEKSSWKSRILGSWSKLSLRRKATVVSIAISVVPIAVVGSVAHHFASQSLMRQIIEEQETRTFDLRQKVNFFTHQLINDADTIASSPLITDPELSEITTITQKVALLNNYIDSHQQRYDSIAVFDLEGNLLFQSKSSEPFDPAQNYSNREYFQRAIVTKAAAINNPDITSASGVNNLEVAVPIKEESTETITGVVRVRMPLAHWQQMFQRSQIQGLEYNLIDSQGKVFAANESDVIGHDADTDFVDLPLLQAKMREREASNGNAYSASETGIMLDRNDGDEIIVSLASIADLSGILDPGWQVAVSRPVDKAFAPLSQLRWSLFLGTTVSALLVGSIAALLARRATLPVLAAAGAVKKIGEGNWNTSLEVQGEDELALLGSDINKMAKQLKSLVAQKDIEARRSRILKDLTLKLAVVTDSQEIFQIAVDEMVSIFKVDRAIIYHQQPGDGGRVMAEAIRSDRVSRSEDKQAQLNYLHQYVVDDDCEPVRVINDIYQAKFKLTQLKQLEALEVKSELSAPLFVGQEFKGFIVIHQCDRSRAWKQSEIDFFAQLASQVSLAQERTELLLQQKQDKEQLQAQAMELLMQVEPISRGDLTVRAVVSDGEIGTLADSYNSTVESLRQIVTQVQKSVMQIATNTNNNGKVAESLSERATQQSEAISSAFQQIQLMSDSIKAVARYAGQVEIAFKEASDTVAVGNTCMTRTVEGISAIRETVADATKKVKRLGESSQKISQVVHLINSFADRTNLLALNASLEANRGSHDGQNFGVVAQEIQTLAKQSAQATTEIEKLVASIQLNTKEVTTAMEQGNEKVVTGTDLVDETRLKLKQIAASNDLMGDRLEKITVETTQQSHVSQQISQTIAGIAQMATITSTDAIQVSESTKELLNVTQDLQASTSKFKV